jgi:imidazolonepropionase-like amidohydrolase
MLEVPSTVSPRLCIYLMKVTGILLGTVFLSCTLDAEAPRAFVGAHLIPLDGPEISNGILVIRDGKILAVGMADQVQPPEGSEIVPCQGKTIMPGLVCTHSHIGGVGAADGSSPIQPGVRVYESINVHDSGFKRALAGGLTTLNIMPGSGHLISGQTVYVKLRFFGAKPRTIEDLLYGELNGKPLGGLKMANGTNSMGEPPFPGTRGKSAFLVREQYIKAREYQERMDRAGGDPEKMPARDLNLEALVEAMQGKRIVHHHTHRHDDIITVLRLAHEFHFAVVLHHVSEGWRVAKEIAEANVPCSIILLDSPGGKLETLYKRPSTGKVLEDAGVRVAYHTDDWITDSRLFLRMAGFGVRGGMSREGALRSVSLAGAQMLGLQDRIGTLTPGKDADFILLSGDPFSIYTKVLQTWVEGNKAFDREDPGDRLYAEGGYGAGRDQQPYFCCFEQVAGGNQ